MPQSLSQKATNTFIRGLITEAGELTFPENASVDELNCDIKRDGTRGRRKAAAIESNAVSSTFTVANTALVNVGKWENVGGQAGLEFLVLQVDSTLHFYNKGSAPFSGNEETATVDLGSFERAGGNGAGTAKCQFASVEGVLVVASPEINTFYVDRDNVTETLATNQINFRTRDFDWQGDTADYDEGVVTGSVTTGRDYDTANVGWDGTKGDAALTTYTGSESEYPPLTLPWYSGKDASGNFSVTEWQKIFAGTTLAGNGHFVLDFFSKDRTTASGVSGIDIETEASRFTTVTSFGNRVFYSGLDSKKNSGTVLFTRVLAHVNELGDCFQRNDPTAEELSDILDDDGGEITIQGAVGIKKLHPVGANLLVFAENGVWLINGADGIFRASEYSIQKVAEVGLANPQSFVSADGVPFWWSTQGIHTLVFDEVSGSPREENISISTIQSFWNEIDGDSRLGASAAYDRTNKRIYWAYADANGTSSPKLNHFLILDLTLQAFFPWSIADEAASSDYVIGVDFYSGFGADSLVLDVVNDDGDDVVDDSSNDVVADQTTAFATSVPSVVLIVRQGSDSKVVMGTFSGTDFLDWGSANYSSYAEAGYDFLGDLMLSKTAPYIQIYSRVTETGWTVSGDSYTPVNESSILVSSFWDFKTTASSTAQQAYRFKYTPVVDPGDLNSFDYPHTVLDTRLKLRGSGKSMRLRFESEQGKNFELLGYAVLAGRNQRI